MIKQFLFGPYTVAGALIVGGAAMIVVEKVIKKPRVFALDAIGNVQCLGIGIFQCLALWPGVSRSAATIVGGLLLGLDRKTAAEFSFLIAVPVMAAAAGYDLLKSWQYLDAGALSIFALGFVVSFVTAIAAIRFFIAVLEHFTLVPFGLYRVALGIIVLLLLR